LCRDNDSTVKFDASSVLVKDNTSGDVLLQASSSRPIYTIHAPTLSGSVPANVALMESTNVCHHQLGYCGASVFDTLRKNGFVQFKSVSPILV